MSDCLFDKYVCEHRSPPILKTESMDVSRIGTKQQSQEASMKVTR